MRVGSFILSSCCTLTLIYLPIASSNAGKTPSFAQPNVRASSFTSKRAKARQSGCSFKAKSSGSAGWDENEIEKNISSGDFLDANVEKSTVWEYFGNLKASDVYGSDAKGRYKGNNDVNVLHNLGQGFPDSSPPPFAISALKESIEGSPFIHQYTRSAGHPLLVKEISERYSRHLNRNIDHLSEVAITVGASQALYLSLQTLINEGDEVILFEPFFDLYVNQIKMAGGVPVFVPLDFVPYPDDETGLAGSWQLNEAKLRSAFSSRTRAVILNSPHNPTGKVFTRSEMETIADAVRGFDRVKVLSDEVYKFIIHSHSAEVGAASTAPGHTHFASLPGMWDRTLTVSSAGKTFSATGWQVGWCVGPSDLVKPIQRLLPYVQFCANSICQQALAITLRRADMPYEVVEEGKGVVYDTYYKWLVEDYTKKRDHLVSALQKAGFSTPDYSRTPGGGFFIMAGITDSVASSVPDELMRPHSCAPTGRARLDWALCEHLSISRGVGMIPSSPFFSEDSVRQGKSDKFVRVAFCKQRRVIEGAGEALLLRDAQSVLVS